jgi:hypothetical protein
MLNFDTQDALSPVSEAVTGFIIPGHSALGL